MKPSCSAHHTAKPCSSMMMRIVLKPMDCASLSSVSISAKRSSLPISCHWSTRFAALAGM
jgi:hypothetical protein